MGLRTVSLGGVWVRERKSKVTEIPSMCEALDQVLVFERLFSFHSHCNTKR